MKKISQKSLIASFVSLVITPSITIAAQLPPVSSGQTVTATEDTLYDQAAGPSGMIYINGGTLNIENNVTVDSTNSSLSNTGAGVLVLGDDSVINGSDNLTINVNQEQVGLRFNRSSSNASISLGNNASISSMGGYAILLDGTGNKLDIGDNSSISSTDSVALFVTGTDSVVKVGTNANIYSAGSSAITVNGTNANVYVDDGSIITADTGYGVNVKGNSNTINLGKVQLTGSRAVLLAGTDNTINIGDGSVLTEVADPTDSDGAILAVGGVGNTLNASNVQLVGNANQIIRFAESGAGSTNDGNVVNLYNATISNDFNKTGFEENDSIIGILTTNNRDFQSEYQYTLNMTGGSITTVNSNLINTDIQKDQSSDVASTAKALINISDVAINTDKGHHLISFGSSSLLQNSTDLTLNLSRTDASGFSEGIINNDQSNLLLNLDSSQIMGDIVNNTGSQGDMMINASNGSSISGNIYALNSSGEIDNNNAYTSLTLNNSTWFTTGDSHVVNLTNGGNVVFNSPNAGNTLTVHGNYIGDNGSITFNGQLADDDSIIDKLIVKGDTSGSTSVRVNNLGGQGDKTINGIELISVDGNSDGQFMQDGRIVAGAYDYSLVQNGKNWYLTNQEDPTDPTDPVAPQSPNERPEAGSYTDNLIAANTMFNTRLHDRLGETQYTDMLTGEQKVTSMWLRNVGGHTRWRSESGQLNTQSNRYVMQLGGDLAQWSSDGLDRIHLGMMAGYGHQHSNTTSSRTEYKSKGSLNGYSTGLYGTWYQNDADKNGLYVDGWAQYNWFNNTVKGEDLSKESYKSKGFTASLESGYTHKLGEFAGSLGTNNEWFVQPKAQVTWMGVKANEHIETNGTHVQGSGNDNVQTRMGVKTFLKSHNKIDDGKDREFQPFVEANWIHNTHNYGVSMDDASVYQAGTRNIGELKTGVEGQLSKNLNLWGNVGVQIGDKGYNDTAAMAGVKVIF